MTDEEYGREYARLNGIGEPQDSWFCDEQYYWFFGGQIPRIINEELNPLGHLDFKTPESAYAGLGKTVRELVAGYAKIGTLPEDNGNDQSGD